MDQDERNDLLGPIWFDEGGAEYMAQIELLKAIQTGVLKKVNSGENRWPFSFVDQMRSKMESTLQKLSNVCPGTSMGGL